MAVLGSLKLNKVPSSAEDDHSESHGSSSKGSKKKWRPFVRLNSVPLDVNSRSGSYELLEGMVARLEAQAQNSSVLRNTCRRVIAFANELKAELPKHRDILTGERSEPSNKEENKRTQVVQSLGTDTGRNVSTRNSSASDLPVDDELVIKTFPVIESSILKLTRRLRLLCNSVFDGDLPEGKLLTLIGAIDLLSDIHAKLLGLMSPLQDIELRNSSSLARIDPIVEQTDSKELVEQLKLSLTEVNFTNGTFKEVAEVILEQIYEQENQFVKPMEILLRISSKLSQILAPTADKCDLFEADIDEKNIYRGKFCYKSDYGDDYEGEYKDEKIYCKVVNIRQNLSAVSRRELQVEIDMLRKLKHENLSFFYGSCVYDGELQLIWRFYESSVYYLIFDRHSIQNWIEINNRTIVGYACDILRGLEFLHHRGIVHQVLNTKNVFIKSEGGVALGDFCFVEGKRESRKTLGGSTNGYDFYRTYRAPETIGKNHRYRGEICNTASDIYSFGVILYELLDHRKAFADLSKEELHNIILGSKVKRPNFTEGKAGAIPDFMKDTVTQSWQHKPELRPTASNLLKAFENQLKEVEEPSSVNGKQMLVWLLNSAFSNE